MKTKRKRNSLKLYQALVAILLVVLVLTGVAASYFFVRYYKLLRVNQFSRNIVLSDNYFLKEYATYLRQNVESGDEEPHPIPPEEATYTLDALIPFLEAIRGSSLTDYEYQALKEHGYMELDELSGALLPCMLADMGYILITELGYDGWTDLEELGVQTEQTADDPYISGRVRELADYIYRSFYPDNPSASEIKRVLSVPHICQLPDYPNGCEAVSAVMLLRSAGFDLSVDDFIADYLPKQEVKITWGCRYGPDPSEYYAGDPASERGGWGCFAPVIVKALNRYLPKGHIAKDLTGFSLEALQCKYLDQGIPVAVWVTQDYSMVNEVYQWQSYDKSETYLYPKNQHCVVLIGYDRENYYFSDPLSEEEVVSRKKEDVRLSYSAMGMQAVAVLPGKAG